ncbi:hypothetical protein ACPDHJ_15800, partial [Myroides sp. C8-3]|uniref:hypothetical protein n=1 Tax=Myroides sp. C8-3 TaxID=3400533 RepID=UPI003D2F5CFB
RIINTDFVALCSSLFARRSLLVALCSSFDARRSMLVVRCSSFDARRSMLVVKHNYLTNEETKQTAQIVA